MKKFFKYLFKVLGVAIFVAITAILVIYALDILNVISVEIPYLDKIPGWEKVEAAQLAHPRSFTLIVLGIATIFCYGSIGCILSLIPVIGKPVRKVIKMICGWLFILATIILITVGALGMTDVISFIH